MIALAVIWLPGKLLLENRVAALAPPVPLAQVDTRERLGQTGFVAVLGGFRSVVADFLFIDAQLAWERTDWTQLLLRLRQVTTLQPHATLFWDMAGWHMAWNASAAALNNKSEPPAVRARLHQEYLDLGRDFLERGVANNPNSAQLHEALARLYREKFNDHARASEQFAIAARLPDAHAYDERFAAYELSYCDGKEREAYDWLRALYDRGERERLPTLIKRLHALEERLNVPPASRIPD